MNQHTISQDLKKQADERYVQHHFVKLLNRKPTSYIYLLWIHRHMYSKSISKDMKNTQESQDSYNLRKRERRIWGHEVTTANMQACTVSHRIETGVT